MTMLAVAWKEPSRETEVSENLCLPTETKDKVISCRHTIPEKLVIRRLFLPCLSIKEDAIMVPTGNIHPSEKAFIG
jgi:hypothetical protein